MITIQYNTQANTESFVVMNRGVLHKEGGWPKDVDPTDVEHTLRYKKKVEKDEEYMKIVKNLCEVLLIIIITSYHHQT